MIRYTRTRRMPAADLTEVLEKQFFLLRSKIRDVKTQRHYRRAVRWLGEFLGRSPLVDDLTDPHLAGLMQWLSLTRSQSPVTVNVSHKCLACLWRWCRDKQLAVGGPTVSPLSVPRRTPTAMNGDEVGRLIKAAAGLPGSICGLPARVWWLTLLAIEFDTGARAGELLAMRWEWIDWQRGWIRVPAEVRKGRQADASFALADDTLQWLQPLRKNEGLILGWGLHMSRYYQHWDELLEMAGLPRGRRNKTHMLRRTYATMLAVHGGTSHACAVLGHSSQAITVKHYLDPTMTERREDRFIPLRVLPGTSEKTGTE